MCKKPLLLEDREVKCGHCIECLIEKSQEWTFRVEYEQKSAYSGVFVTLTYNDEHLPTVLDPETGEMLSNLVKKHWQTFMKNLRRYDQLQRKHERKIRFFACGEYGKKYDRAHYHGIIFNLNKETIKKIDRVWKKGFAYVGNVEPKSIRYVTNYMLLKDHKINPLQAKPFTLMSRKPGLGSGYIEDNYATHNMYFNPDLKKASKFKQKLPRYYQSQTTDKAQEMIKQQKIERYEKYQKEQERKARQESPLDPGEFIRNEKEHKEKIRRKRLKSKL